MALTLLPIVATSSAVEQLRGKELCLLTNLLFGKCFSKNKWCYLFLLSYSASYQKRKKNWIKRNKQMPCTFYLCPYKSCWSQHYYHHGTALVFRCDAGYAVDTLVLAGGYPRADPPQRPKTNRHHRWAAFVVKAPASDVVVVQSSVAARLGLK